MITEREREKDKGMDQLRDKTQAKRKERNGYFERDTLKGGKMR